MEGELFLRPPIPLSTYRSQLLIVQFPLQERYVQAFRTLSGIERETQLHDLLTGVDLAPEMTAEQREVERLEAPVQDEMPPLVGEIREMDLITGEPTAADNDVWKRLQAYD